MDCGGRGAPKHKTPQSKGSAMKTRRRRSDGAHRRRRAAPMIEGLPALEPDPLVEAMEARLTENHPVAGCGKPPAESIVVFGLEDHIRLRHQVIRNLAWLDEGVIGPRTIPVGVRHGV